MTLLLEHTGTQVTLSRFQPGAPPRSPDPSSNLQTGYSYNGAAFATGPRRRTEKIQITAWVDDEQWRRLELIKDKFDQSSRTPPYALAPVVVTDSTRTVTEVAQTRQASGAVATNGDGSVTYSPQLNMHFNELREEVSGSQRFAILVLSEGTLLEP